MKKNVVSIGKNLLRAFLLLAFSASAFAVGEAMGMFGPEKEDWTYKEEAMLKEIEERKKKDKG